MAMQRRAVITGSGAFTPIGNDSSSIWDALVAGRSGIGPITAFDVSHLSSRIAGEVKNFVANKFFDRKVEAEKTVGKSLRMMARTIQLGLVASKFAMVDARLQRGQFDPTRYGVVFGSSMIAIDVDEIVPVSRAASPTGDPDKVDLLAWGQNLETIEPTWMLKFLPNMAACHVSVLHDLQGPSNSITEDDVAGLMALGEAYRIVQRGTADGFVVGASDSKISYLSLARHAQFLPLSQRNDSPAKACRPFDDDANGMVLGEGGTVMVVEELETARKRSAPIRAEIVGFGAAFDSRGDGSGVSRAIVAALRQAGISPDQLDHVNAHAYGVKESDSREAHGIRMALGSATDRVPVFASKGFVGNLGPAGALTELWFSLLAMEHGQLPASINCDRPAEACPVVVHREGLRPLKSPYALKVSYTDLGQCAAVVIKKWE